DQLLHRPEGVVVGELARRERPDVAQRHRPEPGRDPPGPGLDLDPDVEDGDPVEGDAAELDRAAVAVVLVVVGHVADADVGGSHGAPCAAGRPMPILSPPATHRPRRIRMIPDWQLPPGVDRGLWDYLHSGEM